MNVGKLHASGCRECHDFWEGRARDDQNVICGVVLFSSLP
jgi:hypothetical protein